MKTKIIFSISVLGAIIYLLMIFACATTKPVARKIDEQTALKFILDNIGSSTQGRKIYHSYEGEWNYSFECIHSITWKGKHSPDVSLLGRGKTKLSFSSSLDNIVSGTIIEIGNTTSQNEFVGRFNKNKLMFYAPKGNYIDVYDIVNEGRQLVNSGFYKYVDDVLTFIPVKVNGSIAYNNKDYTYNTTYLLSSTDDYLGEPKKVQPTSTQNTQTTDPKEKFEKLKKLLDSGLITKEEYDKKRKEIIDNL